MKKTKPAPDQECHEITRAGVEYLAQQRSDHQAGVAFRELLTTSDQQTFEIWVPKGYCSDWPRCRPRS